MKVIPLIYDANKTALDGYALGSLPDAIECKVTEERNGEFYAEMTYPANGLNADLITLGRIIAVKADLYGSVQGFRVNQIEKDIAGKMTITAYHVSYDLTQVVVMPFTAANIADALTGLVDNAKPANAFTFSTDKTTTATFTVTQPTPLRSLLVGMEGSLVDVYGGELRFDNWNVSLLSSRGQARNVQIAYAKNLTSFKETDELGTYDAVVPYAVVNDTVYTLTDTTVCATAPVVPAATSYGYPRTIALDLTDQFDTAPTQAQLLSKAQSYINRNTSASTANMATTYLDLQKLLGPAERVDLCDTVYLTVRLYKIYNLTLKVIKTTYDVLLDEYSGIEVGDKRITLADELAPVLK